MLRFVWKHSIVIIIVLQVALGLVYLKTVPRIYMDEAWDSSLGYNLASTGALKHPFVEGFGGMHIHFVQNRVILPLVCAAIFKVAGYSIVTSRIGSLLFGILAVVSLYFIMRHWFGEKQAFCIAVITILHPWFFECSRRVRPEIYLLALALAALWCAVYSLDFTSRRAALFSGILAGLAGLSHPTGFVLDLAVAAAVLLWLRSKIRWRLTFWVCLGFAAAILPYLIYVFQCIQDPGVSFTKQMQSGDFVGSLVSITGELSRWKSFLQWPRGAPLALIMIASWLLAWYRSSTADKILATIIGLFSLLIPFGSVTRSRLCLTALVPFFCALILRLTWRIIAEGGPLLRTSYKFRLVTSIGIVVVYVSACTAGISIMFYRLRHADFDKPLERIAAVVGRDSRVYGDILLCMGHGRFHYGPFPVERGPVGWYSSINEIRKHRFDYAVRTAWSFNTTHGVDEPPLIMPDFAPLDSIDEICRQFGTKVDEFRDPYFGPFEIYKLDWGIIPSSHNRLNPKKSGIRSPEPP